jgi:hypothetical protein
VPDWWHEARAVLAEDLLHTALYVTIIDDQSVQMRYRFQHASVSFQHALCNVQRPVLAVLTRTLLATQGIDKKS